MKLYKKIISLLLLAIFVIFNFYKSYAVSEFNIIFDVNKNNYEKSNNSMYKEIEINNIAPGTSGNIIIKVSNSKEDISYFLEFLSEENKPHNIKFIFKNKEYNSLLELNNFLSGSLNKNEEKIIEIIYNWNYETGSSTDEIEKNDIIDTLDNNKLFKFKLKLGIENDIKESTYNPKTGDNILLFVMLLVFSIIGIIIMKKYKQKLD